MNVIEDWFMRGLAVVVGLAALRWPRLVLTGVVALVVFTAFGPWPAGVVALLGLLGPGLRRVRREGVSLGRRSGVGG